MTSIHPADVLSVWERGSKASPNLKALLLVSTFSNEASPEEWLDASVGRRDGALMDAYRLMFGPRVDSLATCRHCQEQLEVSFDIEQVRSRHDGGSVAHTLTVGGYEFTFRCPRSGDLLALDAGVPLGRKDPKGLERALLERCVLSVVKADEEDVCLDQLPDPVVEALSQRMSELDEQAEVVLRLCCAACGHEDSAPFDITGHFWARFDLWARALLREVHSLAAAYHWSERAILEMTPVRRRAYLHLIGGC
jgi:hypothetical protein